MAVGLMDADERYFGSAICIYCIGGMDGGGGVVYIYTYTYDMPVP